MIPDLEIRLHDFTDHNGLLAAPHGLWLDAPDLDSSRMGALVLKLGMRLSTRTAIALENGETGLIYHFVEGSTVLNIKVCTHRILFPPSLHSACCNLDRA